MVLKDDYWSVSELRGVSPADDAVAICTDVLDFRSLLPRCAGNPGLGNSVVVRIPRGNAGADRHLKARARPRHATFEDESVSNGMAIAPPLRQAMQGWLSKEST